MQGQAWVNGVRICLMPQQSSIKTMVPVKSYLSLHMALIQTVMLIMGSVRTFF